LVLCSAVSDGLRLTFLQPDFVGVSTQSVGRFRALVTCPRTMAAKVSEFWLGNSDPRTLVDAVSLCRQFRAIANQDPQGGRQYYEAPLWGLL